jgi:hypothetical protein
MCLSIQGVGLSHAAFSKHRVHGPGATQLLHSISTNMVPKNVGDCRLTYCLTPKSGNVEREFTVAKVGDDDFILIGVRDMAANDSLFLDTECRNYNELRCVCKLDALINWLVDWLIDSLLCLSIYQSLLIHFLKMSCVCIYVMYVRSCMFCMFCYVCYAMLCYVMYVMLCYVCYVICL